MKSEERVEVKHYPLVGRIYRHYKGGTYKVITIAKHTETGDDMVVYVSLEHGSHYVRPLAIWNGVIERVNSSRNVPRFKLEN